MPLFVLSNSFIKSLLSTCSENVAECRDKHDDCDWFKNKGFCGENKVVNGVNLRKIVQKRVGFVAVCWLFKIYLNIIRRKKMLS